MSDALPTPPASPSRRKPTTLSPDTPRADLAHDLDMLLERYLHLLDEQQNLQDELGKQMSAGFLSLARANQSCPPGRWYGRDYYDERMKAMRKTEIGAPNTASSKAAIDEENEQNDDRGGDKEHQKKRECQPLQAPSFKTILTCTPGDSDADSESAVSTPNTEEKPSGEATSSSLKTPPSASRNPLRWFGILVPPSLRAAQGSFISAIEGPVPQLARVVGEMREVEGEVDKLRSLLEAERNEL